MDLSIAIFFISLVLLTFFLAHKAWILYNADPEKFRKDIEKYADENYRLQNYFNNWYVVDIASPLNALLLAVENFLRKIFNKAVILILKLLKAVGATAHRQLERLNSNPKKT